MTAEEEKREYTKLFILVMEAAGEQTENDVYKNVEEILKVEKYARLLQQAYDNDETPLGVFISLCIFCLLAEIHGFDNLRQGKTEDMDTYLLSMWEGYLKKPTRKFTAKYGISPVDEIATLRIIEKTIIKDEGEF